MLAYGVAQRRRELGVRMALGGTRAACSASCSGRASRSSRSASAIGLAASVVVGQVMKSQLFNVTPISPIVIALVTLALSIVALIASGIPALRASRINPIVVLGK